MLGRLFFVIVIFVIFSMLGLNIHRGKSKVLKLNALSKNPIKLADEALEEVESFIYLGSIVNGQGATDADVKTRIGKARAAFLQLKNFKASRDLSLNTKVRLLNSNVEAILLYGAETWRTTFATNRKIQTFINTCLRRILKIRWPATINNEELCRAANYYGSRIVVYAFEGVSRMII